MDQLVMRIGKNIRKLVYLKVVLELPVLRQNSKDVILKLNHGMVHKKNYIILLFLYHLYDTY